MIVTPRLEESVAIGVELIVFAAVSAAARLEVMIEAAMLTLAELTLREMSSAVMPTTPARAVRKAYCAASSKASTVPATVNWT